MRCAEVAQLTTSLRARLARKPPGYQFTIGRAELEGLPVADEPAVQAGARSAAR